MTNSGGSAGWADLGGTCTAASGAETNAGASMAEAAMLAHCLGGELI